LNSDYKHILQYAKTEKRWLSLLLLLTVISAGLATLSPWPLKLLVDHALGDQAIKITALSFLNNWSAPWLIALAASLSLLISLVFMLVTNLLTWGWSVAGQRMVYRFATDLFDHIQRLTLRFHSRSDTGDLLSRITGDTYCVYQVTEAILISPLRHSLTILLMVGVAWQLSPRLTLILLAAIPLLILLAWHFGPMLRARATDQRDASAKITSFVHQVMSAIPIVQVFCAEDRNLKHYQSLSKRLIKASAKSTFYDNGFKTLNGLSTTITFAIVLYVGGLEVIQGTMTIGSMLVFLQYGRSMITAFSQVMATYSNLKKSEANITRVAEILDSKEILQEPEHPVVMPQPTKGHGSRIIFDHVSYGYEPDVPVLHNVSLKVEPGEHVAIVGSTGAGKTTLLSLLPRFADPWSGHVTLDGVDLRNASIHAVRQRIAIVMQRPILLPITIAENIAFGCADASMPQIIEAAQAANAHDFISKLPSGYETLIGENSYNLSGGERQRISIARALINDASVVILDEPTSALDGESEQVVLNALERLTDGRTTFTIAHRLSTAQSCDRILVMQDGCITEDGTHGELLTLGGTYAELFHAQNQTEAIKS